MAPEATTFDAIRLCACAMLAGRILQAGGVSAGNGAVIDWRTVKSGETIQEGADAFDTAQLFVTLVGTEAVSGIATNALHSPTTPTAPHIIAFMARHDGARRRCFEVGPFSVYVEPHENDAAQEAFTIALARVAGELTPEED